METIFRNHAPSFWEDDFDDECRLLLVSPTLEIGYELAQRQCGRWLVWLERVFPHAAHKIQPKERFS